MLLHCSCFLTFQTTRSIRLPLWLFSLDSVYVFNSVYLKWEMYIQSIFNSTGTKSPNTKNNHLHTVYLISGYRVKCFIPSMVSLFLTATHTWCGQKLSFQPASQNMSLGSESCGFILRASREILEVSLLLGFLGKLNQLNPSFIQFLTSD